MSVFFVASDELKNALETAVEVLNRGRFFWPEYADVPFDSTWWLMEFTSAYELRKLTVSYTRAQGTNPVQDAAQTTHHFLNRTAGLPDATWTSADYAAVEALFDTFWGSIKDRYSTTYVLAEYEWRADGPAFRPHGSTLSPTLRRTARSVAGTSASQPLPPQCAHTVTEVTAARYTVEDVEGSGTQLRNRWGRFYLPPVTVDQIIAGRLATTASADIADAAETMYDAAVAADFLPVMYSPTTGHSWSVDEIHVDDIIDVIRSRRYTEPLTRNARTITAP